MNETKLFVLRPAFQVTDCPEHLHGAWPADQKSGPLGE